MKSRLDGGVQINSGWMCDTIGNDMEYNVFGNLSNTHNQPSVQLMIRWTVSQSLYIRVAAYLVASDTEDHDFFNGRYRVRISLTIRNAPMASFASQIPQPDEPPFCISDTVRVHMLSGDCDQTTEMSEDHSLHVPYGKLFPSAPMTIGAVTLKVEQVVCN